MLPVGREWRSALSTLTSLCLRWALLSPYLTGLRKVSPTAWEVSRTLGPQATALLCGVKRWGFLLNVRGDDRQWSLKPCWVALPRSSKGGRVTRALAPGSLGWSPVSAPYWLCDFRHAPCFHVSVSSFSWNWQVELFYLHWVNF